MYLGIADVWVFLAYLGCIAAATLCIGYGLVNWNRNGTTPTEEDIVWAEESDKLSDKL